MTPPDVERCVAVLEAIREVAMYPASLDLNEADEALDASIRALRQAGGWLPIESAPKGGQSVIWGRAGWQPQQGHWANGPVFASEWDSDIGYLTPSFQPTHWQPLPAPPSPAKEG